MRHLLKQVAALLFFAPLVWAGDEFLIPTLLPNSDYQANEPSYRAVGVEVHDGARTLYVVADPKLVLEQGSVNRVIRDVLRRDGSIAEIFFYSAVREKPQFPAFAIYENIALYIRKDNKTYYGVAAKKLYGGWAYGPN